MAAASAAWGLSVSLFRPSLQPVRGMATLKEISLRLKSIKNIQKITKSMKMVAASKFGKAEKDLKFARPYGTAAAKLLETTELDSDEGKENHLVIAISSDRGLCGGVHSNVAKVIKQAIADNPSSRNYRVVCVGDKVRTILQRQYSGNILLSMSDVGRKMPTFSDASFLIQEIFNTGYEFQSAEIIYNKFVSVMSYKSTAQSVSSLDSLTSSDSMYVYDDVDPDLLRTYHQYTLANLVYYAMIEGACSEHSSRMMAMDNASKNAGEMIDKLTLTFNRKRQDVITRELIEIISGAAALE